MCPLPRPGPPRVTLPARARRVASFVRHVPLLVSLAMGCAGRPRPVAPPAPAPASPPAPAPAIDLDAIVPEEVDFEPKWQGTSFAPYLVPKIDFAKEGGAVDIVFQFHGGLLSTKEWRAAKMKAVLVAATFGMGSGPYEDALRDPKRFDHWIDEILTKLGDHVGVKLHARRLAVVSFSAGFGAVTKILRQGYAERLDALLLLDSLYATYTKEKEPNPHSLAPFVAYAEEAKAKQKVFLLTHSHVKTYGYAGSAECAQALLEAVHVPAVADVETNAHGMVREYRAEEGNFHVFGFRGASPKDHMSHLSLVGDVVQTYLAKRWARLEAEDRMKGKS